MTAKTSNFSGLLYYNPVAHGFNPVASATITGPDNMDEGATATWHLVTWNVPDGTIYWRIVPSGDNLNAGRFNNGLSGTITVVNKRASISITVSEDHTTSVTGQSFDIVFSTTLNGTAFAAKYGVGINDTSITAPPTISFDFYAGGSQTFGGHEDWWLAPTGWWNHGTLYGPPTHSPYTYPDNSNEKVWVFTGTEALASPNFKSYNGSFPGTAITVQMWIYPVAFGVQVLSEAGYPDVSTGYHYSMIEIAGDGKVHARFYNGDYPLFELVSTNAVENSTWNHIWFQETATGHHSLAVNGTVTTTTGTYTRSKPTTGEYVLVGAGDSTNMGRNQAFQGYLGQLNIADGEVASNYANEKTKHGRS